jgi:hypothetical protein
MRKKLAKEGFQICIKSSYNFGQSRKLNRALLCSKLEKQCRSKVKLNDIG